MKTFTDTAGRTWTVTLHVAALKKLRAHPDVGVDLFRLADDGFKGLADVVGDPVRLVDVLFVLCEEQAKALGVSDEQFGAAMGGDVLLHASDAFVEELIGFFPDARLRATLRTVIDKGRQVRDLVLEQAQRRAEQMPVEPIAAQWMSSGWSTSSPASSASTPGP